MIGDALSGEHTLLKTQTIEEFLAKGGKVTVVPANAHGKSDYVKSTVSGGGGAATIITMDEADLYHGEAKVKKAKKAAPTIDLSALPEALRKKYVDEVISANKEENEEDEEDSE
jgi:hypothetical protein